MRSLFVLKVSVLAMLLAFVLDRLIGDPAWLYRHLPHPAVLMGRAITMLERYVYAESASPERLYWRGAVITLGLVLAAVLIGVLVHWLCSLMAYGWVPLGILMSSLIAQKGLADHVAAVGSGLEQGLDEGRRAVAHIVGRDPDSLDRHGVARAAIESLAENFSDGVTAPVFWGLLFGLPGMLAYKMINTADSMIGYRSERYLHFGRFAARLDDRVNWLPARLSGFLITLAALVMPGARVRDAVIAMRRDAGQHRSPNAGWPETAMAGALDFRLAGPRYDTGKRTEAAWMGHGRADLEPADIGLAVRLFWWSAGGLFLSVLVLALIVA